MNALIRKELRENLKIAVSGLVLFSLLLLGDFYRYSLFMQNLVRGSANAAEGLVQPLTATVFQVETGFFCALLALVLGWFQIRNERQRDLWSFLVHRPMSRTAIFLGKVAAGLGLYFLAAGLPLVVFILWAALPGHVAAPLECASLMPVAALFLAGPVYYFAGMLVAGRQARWFASRSLPLAAALLVTGAYAIPPAFWQALLLLAAAALVLGLAAWGSFLANGFFEGQPHTAKLASAVSLALGAVVAIYLALALLSALLPDFSSPSWSSYAMATDGTVYKITQSNNQPNRFLDLNGAPLKDPKTGLPLPPQAANQDTYLNASWFSFQLDLDGRVRRTSYFSSPSSFFLWRDMSGTLWLYWGRYGRLVAFDVHTRRRIGSLGADGFSPDLLGAPFAHPPSVIMPGGPIGQATMDMPFLNTASTLYQVDLSKRTLTPIFTTPADDPIASVGQYLWRGSGPPDLPYAAVATRHFVYVLSAAREVKSKMPYRASPGYSGLKLYPLQPAGYYALWSLPSATARKTSAGKPPEQVTWFRDGQLVKTTALPDLSVPGSDFGPSEKISALLSSPILAAFCLAFPEQFGVVAQTLWLSLAAAVLFCLPIGWWLARRCRFGLPAQAGWAIFHLLFGIPGLLAFLALHDWPARERCSNCRRLRVVTRDRCEHCKAPFPPPAPLGTEIFELTTSTP